MQQRLKEPNDYQVIRHKVQDEWYKRWIENSEKVVAKRNKNARFLKYRKTNRAHILQEAIDRGMELIMKEHGL